MLGDRLNHLQMAICNRVADSLDGASFVESHVAQILDPELRVCLQVVVSNGESSELCKFTLPGWSVQIIRAVVPDRYVIRAVEMSPEEVEPLQGRRQEFITPLLQPCDVQSRVLLLIRDLTRKNTLANQINEILN